MEKLFFFILLIVSLSLAGCFPEDRLLFQEGRFGFDGESVPFIGSVYIEELVIEFIKITEDEYEKNEGMNVIKNHKDGDTYHVLFLIKFSGEDNLNNYDFKYIGKQYRDTYMIEVNLDNAEFDFYGVLVLRLDFLSSVHNNDDNNTAGRVYIVVHEQQLKNSSQKELEIISFPKHLELCTK